VAEAHWAVIPFVNGLELTQQATLDLLAQSLPTRVLLIANGASESLVSPMRAWVEPHHPRVLLWTWNPGLPSLSGCWNTALRYVWALGGTEALVVNNDIECWRHTYELLLATLQQTGALFVSAVGVKEPQYREWLTRDPLPIVEMDKRGGPDYSFFLVSKEGHQRYPFNENFRPAFFEDLTNHREYMLRGDGQRIFSINIPYLHHASATIKQYTPEERQKFNRAYAAGKAYYRELWGGDVNEERFVSPFGQHEPAGGATYTTTPDLQRRCLAGLHPYDDTRSVHDVGAVQHIEGVGGPLSASSGIGDD
jgi:hypothetical protein